MTPSIKHLRPYAIAVVLAVALLAAACGSDSEDGTPEPGSTAAPSGMSIAIDSPFDGEVVPGTFELIVAVTGVTLDLGPNGELIPGAAHWHVTSDGVGLPLAYDVPSAQIGPLPPGVHTIEVALYLNDADTVVIGSDVIQVDVSG